MCTSSTYQSQDMTQIQDSWNLPLWILDLCTALPWCSSVLG